MEPNLVIIMLSALMGWFILQGSLDAHRVFTHDQDDVHWIAAAAITCLIFFVITLSLSGCFFISL